MLSFGWVQAKDIHLTFVGDIMLGRGVVKSLAGRWQKAFSAVENKLEGDVVFGNLESPLTTAPFTGDSYDLRAPLEAVQALNAFTLLSLANNHAFDAGELGLQESIKVLREASITPFEENELVLLPVSLDTVTNETITLAFVALVDWGNDLDLEIVARAENQADIVIVSIHWGVEYFPVSSRQREVARALIDKGANIIIGHGPHIVQTIECLDGVLIAYSLGNFLFDQTFPKTRQGGILNIKITKEGFDYSFLPTRIRYGQVSPSSFSLKLEFCPKEKSFLAK